MSFVSFCAMPQKGMHFFLWPVALPLLMLTGVLMSLYGVGKWRQWIYLWAVLALPLSILVLSHLASLFPMLGGEKEVGILISIAAILGIYWAVKRYASR